MKSNQGEWTETVDQGPGGWSLDSLVLVIHAAGSAVANQLTMNDAGRMSTSATCLCHLLAVLGRRAGLASPHVPP